ncbi:MerR family transcriptional regulator [Arthrobacter citreus]|uniref:MerR family transcriptional regulator n=1 Tax=Arthrobacter citreus TaxID=1670 RepID=A0ABZ2ZT55_9MICC
MRISELAAETDIPVATIKYYLRSGLLHDGRLTAPRQAEYDAAHVSRLRLIRALLGPGDLSIAAAGKVLEQLDNPPESAHNLLGAAHHAVGSFPDMDGGHPRADALLEAWGWQIDPEDNDARSRLELALRGLEDAGFEPPSEFLDMYAAAMRDVASRELERVPFDTPADALRYVVLGTVLIEPLLLALRRLAHQDASNRIFAAVPAPAQPASEPDPDAKLPSEPDSDAEPLSEPDSYAKGTVPEPNAEWTSPLDLDAERTPE